MKRDQPDSYQIIRSGNNNGVCLETISIYISPLKHFTRQKFDNTKMWTCTIINADKLLPGKYSYQHLNYFIINRSIKSFTTPIKIFNWFQIKAQSTMKTFQYFLRVTKISWSQQHIFYNIQYKDSYYN